MRWYSHIIFSLIVTISFLFFLGIKYYSLMFYVYLTLSIFSSTLPDIDIKRRKNILEKIYYHLFFLPNILLKKRIPHRKITHNFFYMFIFSLPFLFIDVLLNTKFFYIFLLSYFSHIFLDSFTPRGIPLIKLRGNVRTGSSFEYFFTLFWIFSSIVFLFMNLFEYFWLVPVILFVTRILLTPFF